MSILIKKLKNEKRSQRQWLSLPTFLVIASLSILQADVKTVLSEEIKIANVDHDIDDIINTTKNKYRPDSNPGNSRTEAEVPQDTRRQESRQNNSQRNRQPNRKRS